MIMSPPSGFHQGVAPGRLDVMGGIADYSGGLVLQMALPVTTRVAFEPRTDQRCILSSHTSEGLLTADITFTELLDHGLVKPQFARDYFRSHPEIRWASYVLGPVLILMQEKKIDFRGGTFEIRSDVPQGKGVSSSAALEMATIQAVAGAYSLNFQGTEAAVIAQRAENLIAGAPCGLMDQLASAFGQPGWLLPITCQPDQLHDKVRVPEGISFMGLDSGVRHSVEGSTYNEVRCAAFMGLSLMATASGVSADDLNHYVNSGDRTLLPFNGYLCNIPVEEFEGTWERLLPERMSGSDFLRGGGIHLDSVTHIDEETIYAVRTCTAHPVREQARVSAFLNAMMKPCRESYITMGRMMTESNQGYTDCGLWSAATDEIIGLAAGYPEAIAGARVSGGGSGGTVCLLAVGEQGRMAVAEIKSRMETRSGKSLILFG